MPSYKCQKCQKTDDESGSCCGLEMAALPEDTTSRKPAKPVKDKKGKGGKKGGC